MTVTPISNEDMDWLRTRVDDAHFETLMRAMTSHPLCALVLKRDELPHAVLEGVFTALGYRVTRLTLFQECTTAGEQLLRHLAEQFAGQRLEVSVSGDNPPLVTAMSLPSFQKVGERVHFRRDLTEPPTHELSRFEYLDARALGRVGLRDVLAKVVDDVELAALGITIDEQLDILIALASRSGAPDLSQWRVVELDARLAGVSLGQLEQSNGRGTILYVGLVPELRSQGLGRVLHANTLALLHQAGARDYVDTTTSDNHAMLAIMRRHRCEQVGRSTLWVHQRPPRPKRLRSFTELRAFLRDQQYDATVRDEDGWLACPMRFSRHAAVVDFVWLRDRAALQLISTLPFSIPPALLGATGREVCSANAEASVLGLVLDERQLSLRGQVSVFFDADGGIEVERLRRACASLVRMVASSNHRWRALGLVPSAPPSFEWAAIWND